MGVRITVGGLDYQVEDYSVQEEATPLAAGDSSGSVGSFSFTLPLPDPDVNPEHPINRYGPEWLNRQTVEIVSDTNYGFTLGSVESVSPGDVTATVQCLSRMGELNIYNVQAQPYVGTLRGAFHYYAELAGILSDVAVDDLIADRPVALPGFSGELWYHLKQLAAAQDCDISLVSGVILLRPIRSRIAERGRTIQRNGSTGGGSLAQAVEVYWYQTEEITDELVYPPGGWVPEVEVLNVNAGETAEYTLELSASLSSFQEPVMVTSVDQHYESTSVYTVLRDDGFPVQPAYWDSLGGKVEITLNDDTRSLSVTLTGPEGVEMTGGEVSKSFSLALESVRGARYSTLRIVGTGVRFDRQSKRIRTGISPVHTSTEVGVTIDNPFINDLDSLYRAGTRAAKAFTGSVSTYSSEVTTVTTRGDSGEMVSMTYGAVQDALEAELGSGFNYGAAQAYYVGEGFISYGDVLGWWLSQTAHDFSNQTFGNVQGARIWDPTRKRWFRVRSATTTPSGIRIETADDDLTYEDVEEFFKSIDPNITYGGVQLYRQGLSYEQERSVGLRV